MSFKNVLIFPNILRRRGKIVLLHQRPANKDLPMKVGKLTKQALVWTVGVRLTS